MYSKFFLTLCACAVLGTACKKDEKEEEAKAYTSKSSGKYLLETSVKNEDGMSGVSYIQLTDKLEGSIGNTQGEQIEFGASVQVAGNDVYLFDTMKGVGGITRWSYDPATKKLTKGTNLPAPAGSMVGHLEKVSDTKAYLPLYGQGIVWIINPKTMEKTGEINLTQYAHGDTNPEPAMGLIRDGKYYLCLTQVDSGKGWQPYADYQQSDVAIIDIQTDKVEKIASEKATGLTFPTRPMSQCSGMIFTNEAGDIYIATVGYFGFNPANKKCGFICIPKGATEFDTNRSWDISTTTIEGFEYKAASVFSAQYVGNNKVVAYVGIHELASQNPYTAKSALAVLIDLRAKTIKKIEGIPLTDGHSISINKVGTNAIFGAFGTDKVGLFSFDPATGEVQQLLSTQGNPAYFHAFK